LLHHQDGRKFLYLPRWGPLASGGIFTGYHALGEKDYEVLTYKEFEEQFDFDRYWKVADPETAAAKRKKRDEKKAKRSTKNGKKRTGSEENEADSTTPGASRRASADDADGDVNTQEQQQVPKLKKKLTQAERRKQRKNNHQRRLSQDDVSAPSSAIKNSKASTKNTKAPMKSIKSAPTSATTKKTTAAGLGKQHTGESRSKKNGDNRKKKKPKKTEQEKKEKRERKQRRERKKKIKSLVRRVGSEKDVDGVFQAAAFELRMTTYSELWYVGLRILKRATAHHELIPALVVLAKRVGDLFSGDRSRGLVKDLKNFLPGYSRDTTFKSARGKTRFFLVGFRNFPLLPFQVMLLSECSAFCNPEDCKDRDGYIEFTGIAAKRKVKTIGAYKCLAEFAVQELFSAKSAARVMYFAPIRSLLLISEAAIECMCAFFTRVS
jgi:hypothetical protein